MFRVYIFAEMLKAAKGITLTEFTKEQNDSLVPIRLSACIDMMRTYINTQWDVPYSISHMLEVAENLKFEDKSFVTPFEFENLLISPVLKRKVKRIEMPPELQDKYMKNILYDDKFYEYGFDWWVHYKDIVVYEMLLGIKDTGLRISVFLGEQGDPKSSFSGCEDWIYASGLFQWWLFFVWGNEKLNSTYRINYESKGKLQVCMTTVADGLNTFLEPLSRFKDYGHPVPIADGYVQYVCDKKSYEQYTGKKFGDLLYGN